MSAFLKMGFAPASYCGMLAELEDTCKCHIDLVRKEAIKDKQFLEETGKDEAKLYER